MTVGRGQSDKRRSRCLDEHKLSGFIPPLVSSARPHWPQIRSVLWLRSINCHTYFSRQMAAEEKPHGTLLGDEQKGAHAGQIPAPVLAYFSQWKSSAVIMAMYSALDGGSRRLTRRDSPAALLCICDSSCFAGQIEPANWTSKGRRCCRPASPSTGLQSTCSSHLRSFITNDPYVPPARRDELRTLNLVNKTASARFSGVSKTAR